LITLLMHGMEVMTLWFETIQMRLILSIKNAVTRLVRRKYFASADDFVRKPLPQKESSMYVWQELGFGGRHSYDEDRMENRKSSDPEITAKRSVLGEFGNYPELCDDIVEFAKSASFDMSVATHATLWLQNNYERSVMPLQLRHILLSEATSSRSFLR
jgi:Arc/MetJ-type ribon-helix-helix transcriptional regulator